VQERTIDDVLSDKETMQRIQDIKSAIQNTELWLSLVPVDHMNNIEKQKHDIEWYNKQITTAPTMEVRAQLLKKRESCQSVLTSLQAITPTIQKQQYELEAQLKRLKKELVEAIAGKRETGGAGIV